LQLKTSDAYSNVICESCNNELRSISAFRKDLIFKQTHLYGFVEGYVENEEQTPKDYEQPPSRQIHPIKNETADKVEIKMEQQDVEDYSTFISTEYLETLQEDEETGGDYGDNYAEDEEFSYVKRERVFKSEDVKMKAMKKHYKRFVADGMSCGSCLDRSASFQGALWLVWKFVLQGSTAETYRREFPFEILSIFLNNFEIPLQKVHYKIKRCKFDLEFLQELLLILPSP
jgi:hypothetical protein